MPGLNQSGPNGQGPMTGRRMGRCANSASKTQNPSSESKGNDVENNSDNFQGRGLGRGRAKGGQGAGMGRQNRFGRQF